MFFLEPKSMQNKPQKISASGIPALIFKNLLLKNYSTTTLREAVVPSLSFSESK
jgi:hypothetical protein